MSQLPLAGSGDAQAAADGVGRPKRAPRPSVPVFPADEPKKTGTNEASQAESLIKKGNTEKKTIQHTQASERKERSTSRRKTCATATLKE